MRPCTNCGKAIHNRKSLCDQCAAEPEQPSDDLLAAADGTKKHRFIWLPEFLHISIVVGLAVGAGLSLLASFVFSPILSVSIGLTLGAVTGIVFAVLELSQRD